MAEAAPDARRRADYGGLALVFAELAGCRPPWKSALEGWNVQQSQQVLEWQAQAYERGKTEGKAEGKVEGKAEGKAETLLHQAERRLKAPVPTDLAARIRSTTDLAQLDRWLEGVLDVTSPDEFRRLILGGA